VDPKPCVFVHTNHRQLLGALVSQHSLRRSSAQPDAFEVRILHAADHPFLREREGQLYLREGERVPWRYEDLQSFTPLRFRPPEVMGFAGRAVVVDPDVFAVRDVWELLSRDMEGKAIVCRPRSARPSPSTGMASSVMLLDCTQLRHWRCESDFGDLFTFTRDYMDWITLRHEPPESIGRFENEWNDFDHLTPRTRLLHNTKRHTQPWKTGLPVDFTPASKALKPLRPTSWLRPLQRFAGRRTGMYQQHPDQNQERLFFGLLKECLADGTVSEALLRQEMRQNHLRHDALEVLERTPPLAA